VVRDRAAHLADADETFNRAWPGSFEDVLEYRAVRVGLLAL
jgi:hypothetical protein